MKRTRAFLLPAPVRPSYGAPRVCAIHSGRERLRRTGVVLLSGIAEGFPVDEYPGIVQEEEPEVTGQGEVLLESQEVEEEAMSAALETEGNIERVRRIAVSGTQQMQRIAEDLRVSVAPAKEFINAVTLRVQSTHLVLDTALVVGLFLLLRYGVSRALYFLYHKLDPSRGKVSYKESVFECMQRPLEFLSVFTVGTSLAEVVARPLSATGAARYIRVSRELGIIFAATWFILRWIERIRSRFSSDGRMDKTQVDSISRLATVVTVLIAILVMMDTIGLRLQSVLAFGGIGGVAIGFAGREIISNFFAGFMLFLTRPFSVGDWIRSIENTDVEGTVEDMGWYMTMIRTWEKRPLYIPNSRFSTFIIENPSRMTNRRIKHEIHIRLEDMQVAKDIVTSIKSMLDESPELDPRQHRLAFIDRFDQHSIVIWVSCYSKTVFLSEYRKVQQDVLLRINDIIRMGGARLASDLYRDVREGSDPDIHGPLNQPLYGLKSASIDIAADVDSHTPVSNVPQDETAVKEASVAANRNRETAEPAVPIKEPAESAPPPKKVPVRAKESGLETQEKGDVVEADALSTKPGRRRQVQEDVPLSTAQSSQPEEAPKTREPVQAVSDTETQQEAVRGTNVRPGEMLIVGENTLDADKEVDAAGKSKPASGDTKVPTATSPQRPGTPVSDGKEDPAQRDSASRVSGTPGEMTIVGEIRELRVKSDSVDVPKSPKAGATSASTKNETDVEGETAGKGKYDLGDTKVSASGGQPRPGEGKGEPGSRDATSRPPEMTIVGEIREIRVKNDNLDTSKPATATQSQSSGRPAAESPVPSEILNVGEKQSSAEAEKAADSAEEMQSNAGLSPVASEQRAADAKAKPPPPGEMLIVGEKPQQGRDDGAVGNQPVQESRAQKDLKQPVQKEKVSAEVPLTSSERKPTNLPVDDHGD
ncbi:hypothetical protein NDN08_007795 [Rhodosorus marinus]|uniref:Mechanosensitive ion channel protein n=1 Tax=Rhodosorus marinus TaxID=101924 RepID=A0AAV8V2N8_9RHOD|nr:hypothetical protein NDN08_007795 [Rhodosorus marinus]